MTKRRKAHGELDSWGDQASRGSSPSVRHQEGQEDPSGASSAGGQGQGQAGASRPVGYDSSPVGSASRAVGCPGCAAREREIESLRAMLESAQDRLLAASNPAAFQVYRGQPASSVGAVPNGVDDHGQEFIMVGSQRIPADEYRQQMERLEAQMSGRSVDVNKGGNVL